MKESYEKRYGRIVVAIKRTESLHQLRNDFHAIVFKESSQNHIQNWQQRKAYIAIIHRKVLAPMIRLDNIAKKKKKKKRKDLLTLDAGLGQIPGIARGT